MRSAESETTLSNKANTKDVVAYHKRVNTNLITLMDPNDAISNGNRSCSSIDYKDDSDDNLAMPGSIAHISGNKCTSI